MKQAIVVTGLPASGKTAVAKQLAALLKLPVLDKDDFLEELYEEQFPETQEERRELSRISDTLFQQRAMELDAVVLVSHWRPSCGPQNTGTPTDWLQLAFTRMIEVQCECSPEVATTRFLNRTRHPGHRDQDRDPADLAAGMAALASGYPSLIAVSTEAQVDLPALAAEVLRYQAV